MPAEQGIPRTLAKLKAKQEVRILVLGDSIAAGTGLQEPGKSAYPVLLQELLRKKFGSEKVRVMNRGVGGIESRHGLILIPREVAPHSADLVMLHFGYNDYTSMLEKRLPPAECRSLAQSSARQFIQRIRGASGGEAEVLLVATLPGADPGRRHAMDFFGEEYRQAAAQAKAAYTDAPRAAYEQAFQAGKVTELFAHAPDGALDPAHPNELGHRQIAESLLKAFE